VKSAKSFQCLTKNKSETERDSFLPALPGTGLICQWTLHNHLTAASRLSWYRNKSTACTYI